MSNTIKTVIKIIISFLGGIIFAIFIYLICEYININNTLNNTKYTVDMQWLENKLFNTAIKEEYKTGTMNFAEQLFGQIEFVFKSKDTGKIVGFYFYESSAYTGYTRIRGKADDKGINGITGFYIYNFYDTSLSEPLRASGQVFIYSYESKHYIFDNMRQLLFIWQNDKLTNVAPIR
jgi:hypothetical protein